MEERYRYLPADTYDQIAKTSSAVCCVVYGIIVIYHFISTYRAFLKMNEKGRIKKPLSIYLSLLLIFHGVLAHILIAIEAWDYNLSHSVCVFIQFYGPTGWLLFKFYLYTILVLRLKKCFGDTPLAHNPKKLKIWQMIILIWVIIGIVIHLATTKSINCITTVQVFTLATWSGMDIVATITNAYLFTKPLISLIKDKEDKNGRLKVLAVKQWILSLMATFSTLIALFGVGLMGLAQVFINGDIIISTLSVILSMFTHCIRTLSIRF